MTGAEAPSDPQPPQAPHPERQLERRFLALEGRIQALEARVRELEQGSVTRANEQRRRMLGARDLVQ